MEIDLNTPEGRAEWSRLSAQPLDVNPLHRGAAESMDARRLRKAPSLDTPEPPGSPLSEKAFMAKVRAYAEARGWLVYHTHDSRRSDPGFPDLVLVRDRVLFVELKVGKGKLTKAQKEWRDALIANGEEYGLWTPECWELIVEVLS